MLSFRGNMSLTMTLITSVWIIWVLSGVSLTVNCFGNDNNSWPHHHLTDGSTEWWCLDIFCFSINVTCYSHILFADPYDTYYHVHVNIISTTLMHRLQNVRYMLKLRWPRWRWFVPSVLGEANAGNADKYSCQFKAMINDWRQKFHKASLGETSATFPFGFVQVRQCLYRHQRLLDKFYAEETEILKMPITFCECNLFTEWNCWFLAGW